MFPLEVASYKKKRVRALQKDTKTRQRCIDKCHNTIIVASTSFPKFTLKEMSF